MTIAPEANLAKRKNAARELSEALRARAQEYVDHRGKSKQDRRWSPQTEKRVVELADHLLGLNPINRKGLAFSVVDEVRVRFAGMCIKYSLTGLAAQGEDWYPKALEKARQRKLYR